MSLFSTSNVSQLFIEVVLLLKELSNNYVNLILIF